MNKYNIYKCTICKLPCVGAYTDNVANDDDGFVFKYYCQPHILARGRLQRLWEIYCHDMNKNPAGGLYMAQNGNYMSLEQYINEHENRAEYEQKALF